MWFGPRGNVEHGLRMKELHMRWLSAAFVLFLVAPALTFGQDKKYAELIVGKWEALADKEKVSLEFTKTGTLRLSGNPRSLADLLRCARILYEFNAKPEIMAMSYKMLEGSKLEVESDWSKLLKAIGGEDPSKSKDPKVRGLAKRKVNEVVKVAVNETELTLIGERDKSLTFKRVK
jgi:hypothetical protein